VEVHLELTRCFQLKWYQIPNNVPWIHTPAGVKGWGLTPTQVDAMSCSMLMLLNLVGRQQSEPGFVFG